MMQNGTGGVKGGATYEHSSSALALWTCAATTIPNATLLGEALAVPQTGHTYIHALSHARVA